ncbi:hypothetical protein OS42_05760 [Dickeya oryzae]
MLPHKLSDEIHLMKQLVSFCRIYPGSMKRSLLFHVQSLVIAGDAEGGNVSRYLNPAGLSKLTLIRFFSLE